MVISKAEERMKKKIIGKYMIILVVAVLIVLVLVIINEKRITSADNDDENIISSASETFFNNSYENETNENKVMPVLYPVNMNYKKIEVKDKNIKERTLFRPVGFNENNRYYRKIAKQGFPYYFSSDEVWKEIYVSPVNTIAYEMTYKDSLIICEFGSIDSMNFVIRQLGENINNVLFEDKSWGFPVVRVVEDYLIISYGKGDDNDADRAIQPLILYNLTDNTYKTLETYTYKNNPDGTVTGEVLHTTGGFWGGFVFEIIRFTNEITNIDETGITELYYYDFETKEIEKLPINPERKLLYAGGDRECIVTSDYASAMPLMDTGTLYLLKDGKYEHIKIPGIMSANDIYHAYRITKDVIAVATLSELIFINTEDYTYESIKNIAFVGVNGNMAGYINRKNENYEMELCIFED